MTPEQVVKVLRHIRYSRPPSLRNLARTAGVDHVTLYRAIHAGTCSHTTAQAVSEAMQRLGAIIEV